MRFEYRHMQRDRYMAIFSSRHGDLGAVFVWASNQRDVPAGELRYSILQEAFAQGDTATRTAVQRCPREQSFYMDSLMQVDAMSWSRNRIVLVGDAAHSLTLFSGRGAAAALNGASRLGLALAEHDVQTAFHQYEAQMRPVIRSIQPATRKAVRWYVPRTWLNHMLRDNALRLFPNALFRAYFKKKYSTI